MFESFWMAANEIRKTEVVRKTAEMLPHGQVEKDPFPTRIDGQKFQSGGCYFGIRLAGLHMVNARQYGSLRFPLFVSLAEFRQNGQQRNVSFSIGPKEILNKLDTAGALKDKNAKPGWIELRDVSIVRPTPVDVDNVSLFAGLYSVPGDDIVSTLLNVVGDLSKTAGTFVPTGPINLALDVTKKVYEGFGSLIGLNSLTPLVQAENGSVLSDEGSGYLVIANTPPGALEDEKMVVRRGQLLRGDKMVTDVDYCLLAIERYSTVLEEATGVAPNLFEDSWQDVVKAMSGEDIQASAVPMRKLLATIRGAPSLIESDRTAAMAAYLRRYNEQMMLTDPLRKGETRGGGGKTVSTSLIAERDRQTGKNEIAANKLSAIVSLLDSKSSKKRGGKFQSPLKMAAEIRSELSEIGEGADTLVADALLMAV